MSVAPASTAFDDRFARELPEMAVSWQADEAPDPQLLVLNEELKRELAPLSLEAKWDVVAARREHGRSVLIISHFVVDEDRFDRIVEVRDGRTWPR